MNILIVDDEKLIRDVIKEYCLLERYTAFEAENGYEAIDFVKNNNVDLIVMDIMMPKLDGYQAIREIKKIKNIPCIVLSARDSEYDKLQGFDLGIDDYQTKPFSPRELMSRIKAVTKRTKVDEEKYIIKDLVMDLKAHEVIIKDQVIDLTPKEFELLRYFIQNKNIALTRESLLSNIWGYDFFGDDRTIDTHIKTLRKNLLEYGALIKTVRGVGYKFDYKEK